MNDLVVLVPDADIEQAVRGLFHRSASLGIRPCAPFLLRHSGRDPGCRKEAPRVLQKFRSSHSRAMVIFDRHGCGSAAPREAIQKEVEGGLMASGWDRDRIKAIVIAPELEVWLWNGSPHVSRALGWKGDFAGLRRYLEGRRLWTNDGPKPADPKRAMRAALENAPHPQKRRSARLFFDLARRTTLAGCTDTAFLELRKTLRTWFPRVSRG